MTLIWMEKMTIAVFMVDAFGWLMMVTFLVPMCLLLILLLFPDFLEHLFLLLHPVHQC